MIRFVLQSSNVTPMKYFSILLLIVSTACTNTQPENTKPFETITLQAKDGVNVTGDLYMTDDESAPFILLCHQAGYSRGEYREIAPKLNALGFNCLAIDQRSGKEVNGVENQTVLSAKRLEKKTAYVNAVPDIEAAILYIKNDLNAGRLIYWGSSYSSALAFYIGVKHSDKINAILSFAPGEYFKLEQKSVSEYAAKVQCPVFITSAKNEHEKWERIYEKITSDKSFFLPETEGFHGSKALWAKHEGNEAYWTAVKEFLGKVKG